MWRSLKKWFLGWLNGGPHFVVGDPKNPYLLRWYILPRNDWCCVYLHKFVRDDDDRAMHDHPWRSASLLVLGRYVEQTRDGKKLYKAGSLRFRSAEFAHRVELPGGKPAWTLFITGPRVRNWGFHCPKGWVPWEKFVDVNDVGNIGKGCGEMS